MTTGAGVSWERTRLGECEIRPVDDRLVVTAIDSDDTSLRVTVRTPAGAPSRLAESRFGNDRVTLAPVQVLRGDETTVLEFPLEASLLGGATLPLPSSTYRLFVPASGPRPEQRAFPTLDVGQSTPLWVRSERFDLRVTSCGVRRRAALRHPRPARRERAQPDRTEGAAARLPGLVGRAQPRRVLFGCYRGEFATDSQKALDVALRQGRART